MRAMRVLVVEDDRGVAVSLTDGLNDAGYDVDHVATGAAALQVEAERDVDVVLLDLGLPDMDGRDVCRELRSRASNVPIIMLTARGDEFDRVLGLELGADDYVTKPFSVRELVARIRAVTRRTTSNDGGENGEPQTIGPLTIDRRSRRVTMGDEPVNLTAKEFDLLAFLATDPGAVQSRTEILEHVWDTNWYGPTKTVDAHVAAVRKKLGDGRWIEAVRGVGFRFEEPPA
jgi:DNA-binding response OmpR family regulator